MISIISYEFEPLEAFEENELNLYWIFIESWETSPLASLLKAFMLSHNLEDSNWLLKAAFETKNIETHQET